MLTVHCYDGQGNWCMSVRCNDLEEQLSVCEYLYSVYWPDWSCALEYVIYG